jgi:hypothetical protein
MTQRNKEETQEFEVSIAIVAPRGDGPGTMKKHIQRWARQLGARDLSIKDVQVRLK